MKKDCWLNYSNTKHSIIQNHCSTFICYYSPKQKAAHIHNKYVALTQFKVTVSLTQLLNQSEARIPIDK